MSDGTMNDLGNRPPPRIQTLSEIVTCMVQAGADQKVRVGEILARVGRRSYGPVLLVPSILVVSPLSAIPGFSTLCGLCIALVAGQLLIGRRSPWFPAFVTDRGIDRDRFRRAGRWLGKVAKHVDRLIGPRLEILTTGACAKAAAAVCLLMAAVIPFLELVPMASSTIGAVVAVYGLALTARDGYLMIAAAVMTGAAGAFIASLLM
ncbi:MAG: exopolysaccharide biosynthesis protein [Rhodospirillales bacterium]